MDIDARINQRAQAQTDHAALVSIALQQGTDATRYAHTRQAWKTIYQQGKWVRLPTQAGEERSIRRTLKVGERWVRA